MSSGREGEASVFRPGGISYLQIPAPDPRLLAAFYEAAFGWTVRKDRDDPSFADGSGHVIGHFVADQAVAGEAGVRPGVFVGGGAGARAEGVAPGGAGG